jgi:hypothetical protein
VPEYGQGDQVARRAEIRNSYDFDVVQVVDRSQLFSLRYVEQPVPVLRRERGGQRLLVPRQARGRYFPAPNAGLKLPYDMNDEHLKANLGSTQIDTPARSARAHSGYFDDGATMQKSTLSLTQLPLIGSPICAMSIR